MRSCNLIHGPTHMMPEKTFQEMTLSGFYPLILERVGISIL